MTIESVTPSSRLIFCCPLLPLPSIFPSIRVFSNESALRIRWPKYWSYSFSMSPSNEYSGMISFMIDWFDLLSVQGTLKSLLQHHSSNASILQHSTFLWSNSHIHTWLLDKPKLWLNGTVDKVMFLLFNMLSRLVIAILPRSKHLLISWLQSSSTVILEPKKIRSVSVSIVSPSICHKMMGPVAIILAFECWVLSQLFHSPLLPSSRGSLVPLCFLP